MCVLHWHGSCAQPCAENVGIRSGLIPFRISGFRLWKALRPSHLYPEASPRKIDCKFPAKLWLCLVCPVLSGARSFPPSVPATRTALWRSSLQAALYVGGRKQVSHVDSARLCGIPVESVDSLLLAMLALLYGHAHDSAT